MSEITLNLQATADRAIKALESIAASLEKIANPPMLVTVDEDAMHENGLTDAQLAAQGATTQPERYTEIERQRDVFENVLSTICTASTLDPSDEFGRAYIEASGGYEGLQAIAEAGLKMGRSR